MWPPKNIVVVAMSNEMDQDYKKIEQISEELDRRMARFDTPEKIEFMQNEIEQAILALSNLFGLKAQESIDMPKFVFCDFYDGYNLLLNEISMDTEEGLYGTLKQ